MRACVHVCVHAHVCVCVCVHARVCACSLLCVRAYVRACVRVLARWEQVLRAGDGEKPDHGSRVTLRYLTFLMDDTPVEGPIEATITCGDCDIVQGMCRLGAYGCLQVFGGVA